MRKGWQYIRTEVEEMFLTDLDADPKTYNLFVARIYRGPRGQVRTARGVHAITGTSEEQLGERLGLFIGQIDVRLLPRTMEAGEGYSKVKKEWVECGAAA